MTIKRRSLLPEHFVKCVGTLVHHCAEKGWVPWMAYPGYLKMAARVIGYQAKWIDDVSMMRLTAGWRENLELSGLSEDGTEVIDTNRFNITWEALQKDKLHRGDVRRLIETGYVAPPAGRLDTWAKTPERKVKSAEQVWEDYENEAGADAMGRARLRKTLNRP